MYFNLRLILACTVSSLEFLKFYYTNLNSEFEN